MSTIEAKTDAYNLKKITNLYKWSRLIPVFPENYLDRDNNYLKRAWICRDWYTGRSLVATSSIFIC